MTPPLPGPESELSLLADTALLNGWLKALGFIYDPRLGRVRNPFDFLRAEDDQSLADSESYIPLLGESLFLNPEHFVILGAPGSGKTALRLACHDLIRREIDQKQANVRGASYTTGRAELRRLLCARLSLDEIKTLGFDLAVSFDDLRGELTRTAKAEALIEHIEGKGPGRLRDLIDACKKNHSDATQALEEIESQLWAPPPQVEVYTSLSRLEASIDKYTARRTDRPLYVLLDLPGMQGGVLGDVARRVFTQTDWEQFGNKQVYLRAFLPIEFRELTRHLRSHTIHWTAAELKALIGRRLSWASRASIQQLAEISEASWRATGDPDQDIADAGSTPREIMMRGRALFDRCASIWNASDAPQVKQQDLRWCLTERLSQRPRVAPQKPKGSQERRHFHFVLSHEDGKIWTRVRHSEKVYDRDLPQYRGPSPTQTSIAAREELGRYLFGVLFEEQRILSGFLQALDQTAASRRPLGVHLHFEHNSACLLHYPWELIHDGERFLTQNGSVEVIRRPEFPRRPTPRTDLVPVSPPLPILYVAPRPTDQRGLSSFEEKVLSELPQHIRMRKVLPATQKEVERYLQDGTFHVFHFDGYGRAGYLMFEKEYTPTSAAISEPLSTVEMQSLLSKRELRVAVLSACDSATIPNPRETSSSICSSLIKAGVAGVVGMQSVINASNAASFVQRLYETFADRNNPLPLVDAVAAARRVLSGSADWFVPVLYLRCHDDEGRFFVYDRRERTE